MGEVGELQSCPKVAQQWLREPTSVPNSAEHWQSRPLVDNRFAKCGPRSSNVGKLGQVLPLVDQLWPMWAKLAPCLAHVGQTVANFGQICAVVRSTSLGRCGPKVVLFSRVRPILAQEKSTKTLARLGSSWGHFCPESLNTFDRCRPCFCPTFP